MALKPTTIARADYTLAKSPDLGGSLRVFATTEPAGVIKAVRFLGGSDYETTTYAEVGTYGGVTVTAVGPNGLKGAVSGIIEVPDWGVNRSTNFPCGKAGEGSIPASGWGQRGDILYQLEIPDYDPAAVTPVWFEINDITQADITLPMRGNKAIASGMQEAAYTVPGVSKVGELTLSSLSFGLEEGLLKLGGIPSCVMVRSFKSGILETARAFILNWTPPPKVSYPSGESEASNSATGFFSVCAIISADGTPA